MSEVTVPDPSTLDLDSLVLDSPMQTNRSGWTARGKTIGLPGAEIWSGRITIQDLETEEKERPWRVFLRKLKGPENWFRWPLCQQSHYGPKPKVGTGASDGNTLPLTGMQPNVRILKAGHRLTVPLPSGHFRMVELVENLVSDASGNGCHC